ncbi:GNAT family N-acetyltransferase [Bacillus solitudinis]|uniref:GNAT family N-acetyltransferase n=1 Tax=Bacillus solitudinis TaxID=2014074 RepID=UPI000C239910|nr:GNAT family N-acetyltransferase [Bacillus solitudinis]
MREYEVRQINNLFNFNLNILVKQSKEEGFRFVERLVNDYKNGTNTFNNWGEAIFGVFNEKGEMVAIGGLNKDPYSNKQYIGRLRRFYVSKEYRRKGIGRLLLKRIIDEAKKYYKILVLHTDTKQADNFYTSFGFSKENLYQNTTHYVELEN